jgi:hypothetical protein
VRRDDREQSPVPTSRPGAADTRGSRGVEGPSATLVPATLVGCRRNNQVEWRFTRHPGKEIVMTRAKSLTIPAVVAGAVGICAGTAWAVEPTTEELTKQIQALQDKVQQLESRQTAMNARDVDATVEAVLRDADKRSQLLQMEGFTAGWTKDRGFRIQSADGNWVLNPYFQFQFRNTTNFLHSEPDGLGGFAEDDSVQNGFEIRRMKFGFRGNAFTPNLTYNFKWETDEDGGQVILEDATIQYQFADQWAFMVGQWKDNVFHEETVSSGRQLAVDRSMVNEVLGGGLTDYVQGVALIYASRDNPVRAMVAYHDGLNTDNTNWLDHTGGALFLAPNFGVSGRAEFKVMGDWKAYDDFSAMGNQSDLLVLGAGLDYTEDGANSAWLHTIDAQWENTSGVGVYAAYYAICSELETLTGSGYDWGAIAQVAYLINPEWEAFGRYGYMDLDTDGPLAAPNSSYHELTVGANWYVGGGHNCKVTLDLTWLCKGAPTDLEGIGVLESDKQEFILRGQFQLLL